MQESIEKKFDEIKSGIYDYLIQGIIRTDSNGYEYKTTSGKNVGRIYHKLKIILLSEEKNHYVYKNIFNERDIKEIILGIGNPVLTFVFESDPKNFESETLIGESGKLFLGRNEKDGKVYPQIECFIKPKGTSSPKVLGMPAEESAQLNVGFNKDRDDTDGVPF